LPEINVEHAGHIVRDHRIGLEQIADRAIAIAGLALRGVDGLIDSKVAPGKAAERKPDLLERPFALAGMDQPGARDRAGIHHRVEWMVLRIEPDRVKGIT